jgi:hypothetical protein
MKIMKQKNNFTDLFREVETRKNCGRVGNRQEQLHGQYAGFQDATLLPCYQNREDRRNDRDRKKHMRKLKHNVAETNQTEQPKGTNEIYLKITLCWTPL